MPLNDLRSVVGVTERVVASALSTLPPRDQLQSFESLTAPFRRFDLRPKTQALSGVCWFCEGTVMRVGGKEMLNGYAERIP